MHLLYLDESGHSHDPSTDFFVLAGFSIFERSTHWLESAIHPIAARFNPLHPEAIEFHGAPMRGGKEYWKGFDPQHRVQAVVDILSLLANPQLKLRVFASVIYGARGNGSDGQSHLANRLSAGVTMKLLVAIAAALLVPAVHAASFNCAKAASKVEKAICASPALGKLDDDVAAAYAAARAGLDEPWRPRLLRSQREWLATRSASADLAADLRQRLAILRGIRVTQGGVRFLKLTDDARPMYVLDDVPGAPAYNQWVDSVWVAAVGQTSQLREDGPACGRDQPDCADDSTARTYVTTVPSPGLLSVGETIISYEQGAAHPEVESSVENWWLARAGRVTMKDIFVGTGWKAVIAKAARAYVKSQNDLVKVDADAIDGVSKVDDWTLKPTALVFNVDGYAFNLGRGMAEVEVPWKDFGASLRPEFAAALGLR